MANLIANADFARLDTSGWPAGWHAKTPRRELRPKFAFDRSISRAGAGSLRISGNGDRLAFGCWTTRVPLEPGKTYGIWINSQEHTAFRDAYQHPAVPYLLVFKTRN